MLLQVMAFAGADDRTQSWVQRYDLRRKVDGAYQGLHYGRNQGTWSFDGTDVLVREDLYSVRSLTDQRRQELALDSRMLTRWIRCGGGVLAPDLPEASGTDGAGDAASGMVASEPDPYQAGRFESDWVFDPLAHPEGSTWVARALFCLFPDRTDSWRWLLPQDIGFRNHGLVDWLGRRVWDIRGGTTFRVTSLVPSDFVRWPALEPLRLRGAAPGVTAFGGRREIRVLVDSSTLAPVYLQEKVDAQTVALGSGKKIQLDGVLMTFFDNPLGDVRQRMRDDEALLRLALGDPEPLRSSPPPVVVADLPSPAASVVPPVVRPVLSPTPVPSTVPSPEPVVVPQALKLLEERQDIAVRSSPGGIVLEIPDLGFVADKAVLVPGEKARLDKLAKVLSELRDVSFLVRGHTAQWGSVQVQESLALDRAKLVSSLLKAAGVDPGRIMFEGCGAREPRATNDTPEGRALNRRVEIVVVRGPGAGR